MRSREDEEEARDVSGVSDEQWKHTLDEELEHTLHHHLQRPDEHLEHTSSAALAAHV